jgi:hypothetical protein
MADDARISTALPGHPKTVKLLRRLGPRGCWSLICLLLWTADNRPDGDLRGMTSEDIEIAAGWAGEAGLLLTTLADVRFLDGQDGMYKIHDWAQHNPWAAGRPARIACAKAAAAKRWHGSRTASEPDSQRMPTACEPHESAMPTSPHRTSAPDTTTEPPPPVTEQTLVTPIQKNKTKFSQSDFDARDLRKFADVGRELELRLAHGWGSNLTNDQIFSYQCALAGVTPKHMREVIARVNQEANV